MYAVPALDKYQLCDIATLTCTCVLAHGAYADIVDQKLVYHVWSEELGMYQIVDMAPLVPCPDTDPVLARVERAAMRFQLGDELENLRELENKLRRMEEVRFRSDSF